MNGVKKLLNKKLFIKIIFLISLILLDYISKQLVFLYLKLNNFYELTFFLDIAHIHNYGISFGLFAGLISPAIFVFIASLVTLIIFYMYLISKNKLEKIGLFIIISGAISNILDRALNGYVIDFIYFHHQEYYWPAFNFADIYISIGIFFILLYFLNNSFKRNK